MKNIISGLKSSSALLLAVLLLGCATSGRPYSAKERLAFGNAILGQSLDVMTTSMAMEDSRVSEINPVFWSDDDIEAVLAGKIVIMGAAYLIGEFWPNSRRSTWWILGGAGYAAAGFNTYQMIDNSVNPWSED